MKELHLEIRSLTTTFNIEGLKEAAKIRIQSILSFLVFAGHGFVGEQVKNLVVVYQLDALGMQAYKVCTVFSIRTSIAIFDAEQICIGAIDAFTERNTDLGNCDMTCIADSKQISAFFVFFAAV